ncbi:hypothetical protein R6Q57_003625 [Mikania cordata]
MVISAQKLTYITFCLEVRLLSFGPKTWLSLNVPSPLPLLVFGIAEYQKLITQDPIFLERVEGVGIIGREEAINSGLSGPMLRVSGIQCDLRKVDHYECYDEFGWEVEWQKEEDSLARYLVRITEMTESIKIIQDSMEDIR